MKLTKNPSLPAIESDLAKHRDAMKHGAKVPPCPVKEQPSDTPLTDAETWTIAEGIISDSIEHVVTRDFARDLERKLNAATRELRKAKALATCATPDVSRRDRF